VIPCRLFSMALPFTLQWEVGKVDPMHRILIRPWLARLLIGIVTAWNLQAAFVFIFSPSGFVRAYELSGTAGEAAIRGFGILFLMWNVPYLFAVKDPVHYQLALTFALLMQSIGLIGESCILSTLTVGHVLLRSSILRFIIFDGAGVVFLGIAYLLVKYRKYSGDTLSNR
jgi:hypothetical protein